MRGDRALLRRPPPRDALGVLRGGPRGLAEQLSARDEVVGDALPVRRDQRGDGQQALAGAHATRQYAGGVRLAVLAAVASLAAAGCGAERTPTPDVLTPKAPRGERTVVLEDAGVRFRAPRNWDGLDPAPPLEGGVRSKSAVVAIWRYPRVEPLPAGRGELARAQERLVELVKERDPTFTVRTSAVTEVDEARAIELLGRQTIAGLRYDVRSTHVFTDGVEVVVDAYAPPEFFFEMDTTVFLPLLDSLTLE